MSRNSSTWFAKQSANNTSRSIASAPAIIRSGNSGGGGKAPREVNEKGRGFFKVGQTEIGGEEEVG